MSIPRLHLFEIHDQTWCPVALRTALTDGLFTVWRLAFWRNTLPHLRDLLRHAEEPVLVDLCSGAGGPLPLVLPALQEEFSGLRAVMTDLFPEDHPADPQGLWRRHPEPVDAMKAPASLGACRTMFESLHHFRPDEAVQILADAVRAKQPYAAFEFQRRSLTDLLFPPMSVLLALGICLNWFFTPFRFWKLVWTVIPAFPLMFAFDGVVSVLRTYTPEELAQLARRAGSEGYRWEVRQTRSTGWDRMTCLIGWPCEEGGVVVVDYPALGVGETGQAVAADGV